MFRQHGLCAGIPVITMGMGYQDSIKTAKHLLQLFIGERQWHYRDTLLIACIGNWLHGFLRAEHRINKDREVVNGEYQGGMAQKMNAHEFFPPLIKTDRSAFYHTLLDHQMCVGLASSSQKYRETGKKH